jgi:hypothetical protein
VIATVAAAVSGGGENPAPLWMRILNQQKYPASQLFLLMTMGPAIALLPTAERWRRWGGDALDTFGRVPMWYYLMHILVIHLVSLIAMRAATGAFHNEWFLTAPYTQVPPDARWSLALLWAIWALCILLLYPVCRWYAIRKATRPAPWMRYL